MSETPRTDENERSAASMATYPNTVVKASFARTLERALLAAQREVKYLDASINGKGGWRELCDMHQSALQAARPSGAGEKYCLGVEGHWNGALWVCEDKSCPVHSPPPAEREGLEVALDTICKAAGYQTWWVQKGKLFFERPSVPGFTSVLLIDVRTLTQALTCSQERGLVEKYWELIYAVGNKYPGETRHETALRYIRSAEGGSGQTGNDAKADVAALALKGAK